MARIARFTVPGVLHHVISRFVDRDWFFGSDIERARYLSWLGRALAKSDWQCLAYCLMSNHIHFAMLGGELALESWTKKVNSPFAAWLNKQHGRLGPVFAERPAVYVVPRHREAEVIAYIHNNPVRANVVAGARLSTWSSHRAYLGLESCPTWLRVDTGLALAGCGADRAGFDRLVNGLAGAVLELPDLEQTLADVRRLGPYDVGTPTLSDPVEVPIVRRRSVRSPPAAASLLDVFASVLGVPASAASRRHAHGSVSMMKRAFVHAAVEVGVSIAEASATLNVSRQRGAKIAQTPLPPDERALVKAVVALVGRAEAEKLSKLTPSPFRGTRWGRRR